MRLIVQSTGSGRAAARSRGVLRGDGGPALGVAGGPDVGGGRGGGVGIGACGDRVRRERGARVQPGAERPEVAGVVGGGATGGGLILGGSSRVGRGLRVGGGQLGQGRVGDPL